MAELFLARSADPYGVERMVVLKVVAPRYASDSSFSAMFDDEVRIVANLNHPNIGQVFEVGEIQSRKYLAMEYLHGHDMREIVRALRGRAQNGLCQGIPPHIAAHVAARICAALQHAHEARSIDGRPLNIVHRDVSPSNIMVTFDGIVKLLDFGIARAANRVALTQPGMIKGKVRYLAPEQLLGEQIDHRTDIFTLGVSIWEGTVGCHLFEGSQDIQIYDAISTGKIRRPSEVVASYPPQLERIVMTALSFKKEDRYPTAQHMQADLETYAQDAGFALSELSTANFMRDLFAEEYAKWHQVQQAGQSLLDLLVSTAGEEDRVLTNVLGQEEDKKTILVASESGPSIRQGEIHTAPPPSKAPQGEKPQTKKPHDQKPQTERKTVFFGEAKPFAPPTRDAIKPQASTRGPITLGRGTGALKRVQPKAAPQTAARLPPSTDATAAAAPSAAAPSAAAPSAAAPNAAAPNAATPSTHRAAEKNPSGSVLKVSANAPVELTPDGRGAIVDPSSGTEANRSPTILHDVTAPPASATEPRPMQSAQIIASEPIVAKSVDDLSRAEAADAYATTEASKIPEGEPPMGKLKRRPQTGDWSHQQSGRSGNTRRPGTHPYFKEQELAHGMPNPYDDGRIPRSKAPLVILIVVVVLAVGGSVAAWFALRGDASDVESSKTKKSVTKKVDENASKDDNASKEKQAQLAITSNPKGAAVFNVTTGEELGTTPLSIDFPEKTIKLQLRKKGYKPFDLSVKVGATKLDTVSLEKQETSGQKSDSAKKGRAVEKTAAKRTKSMTRSRFREKRAAVRRSKRAKKSPPKGGLKNPF
jgi:serine/threonine protein kinase/flagellar basal body-associated protein FliL